MIDMNKKVIGMRLSTHANFEIPIGMDKFKEYFDEFMVKTDEVCHDIFNEICPKGSHGVGYPIYEDGERERHIHIRECLRELEKVFNVYDTTNRNLTDEEQHIIDNFSHNFAEAIIAEICPQWSKEIAENILKWHTENKDGLKFFANT